MSNIAQNQNPPIEFDCPHCDSPTEIEAPTLNAMWESEADGQYQCPACQEIYILPDPVEELPSIIYEKDGPNDCVVSISGDRLWATNVDTSQRQVIENEYPSDTRLPRKWSPVTIDEEGQKLAGIPLKLQGKMKYIFLAAIFGFGAWQAIEWLAKDEPYEYYQTVTPEQRKRYNEERREERMEDMMRRGEEAYVNDLHDRYDAGLATADEYLSESQRVKRQQYERKNQD